MGVVLALLVGYGIGAKAGGEGFDELVAACRTIRQSEEFGAAVKAFRSHAKHALREMAEVLSEDEKFEFGNLVDRVRSMSSSSS